MTGHTVRVLQDALGFGVSGSTGFLTPNLEIWTISSSFASHMVQNDPVPPETAHLRAQSTQSRALSWSCSKQPCALRGAALVQCGAYGVDETACARAFQTSCWGRSTRRPALSEPMKLPSEARIRRWALVSFWAASGGPLRPFFAEIAPISSRTLYQVYKGA